MAKIDVDQFSRESGSVQSLLDLSRQCIEQGDHDAAIWFANAVLQRPDISIVQRKDALEKLTVSCFYSQQPGRGEQGRKACEALNLDRLVPGGSRYLAGQNLTWYSKTAYEMMPRTRSMKVPFTPEPGWVPLNPSIALWRGDLWMIQRTVNYTVTNEGKYDTHGDRSVRTRNWICKLDDDLNIEHASEIGLPSDWPEPRWDLVLGFEDSRLFVWDDQLWTTSTVRELTPEGYCQLVLARLDQSADGTWRYADWRVIEPQGLAHQAEKNWMPVIGSPEPRFIYGSDPVRLVDRHGLTKSLMESPLASDSFRGGGQVIPFDDGYLAIVHQSFVMNDGRRRYLHRLVKYDQQFRIEKVSPAFRFDKIGIEFASGLVRHPRTGDLVITAGINDAESWYVMMDPDDARGLLKQVPSMDPQQARYIKEMDSIYGWLLPSAAEIISHTQYHQTRLGISGDCMEIGTFHGRLFVLLALGMQPDERAVGIDIFEDQHLNKDASGFAFGEHVLRKNVIDWEPQCSTEILKLDSSTLGNEFIAAYGTMRWISVDGSHTMEATASDLRLAERCLIPGGIVAVDDMYRVAWSGVTAGIFKYLYDGGKLVPFAIIPNKLLLTTDTAHAELYKAELDSIFPHYHAPHGRTRQELFGSHELLLLKDPSDP